jgi:hypothetical protein
MGRSSSVEAEMSDKARRSPDPNSRYWPVAAMIDPFKC